jgi:Arc/MetJ family transcription regulator
MKRTNLVLDGTLLEQARRELGARTYSATVNQALAELLRLRQVQRLSEFYGSHAWSGDLAEMREDKPARRGPNEPRAEAAVDPG